MGFTIKIPCETLRLPGNLGPGNISQRDILKPALVLLITQPVMLLIFLLSCSSKVEEQFCPLKYILLLPCSYHVLDHLVLPSNNFGKFIKEVCNVGG